MKSTLRPPRFKNRRNMLCPPDGKILQSDSTWGLVDWAAPPCQICVETLTPGVTVFGDRAFGTIRYDEGHDAWVPMMGLVPLSPDTWESCLSLLCHGDAARRQPSAEKEVSSHWEATHWHPDLRHDRYHPDLCVILMLLLGKGGRRLQLYPSFSLTEPFPTKWISVASNHTVWALCYDNPRTNVWGLDGEN